MTMLVVDIREAGYGGRMVLKNVSFSLDEGEIACCVGPNGAGKSTLLRILVGLLPLRAGSVRFDGEEVANRDPAKNARRGIVFVPQGGGGFTELTVRENLEVGGYLLQGKSDVKRQMGQVFDLFPGLRRHEGLAAGMLSGGERQQLALARALMLRPRLLLLDEPTLGLAPIVVSDALKRVARINREYGSTVLIVEQKVREVLKIANRAYALNMGEIFWSGSANEAVAQVLVSGVLGFPAAP